MATKLSSTDPVYGHRVADATVTLRAADGSLLTDTVVTIEQTRHAFSFGNIGFDFIPLANGDTAQAEHLVDGAALELLPHLAELWLDLYNTATLPFYWGAFEPRRGEPQTVRLRKTAEWLHERGVELKGHPLFWHTLAPEWLTTLPLDEVERLQRERIRRELADFGDLIHTWDAINETVILPDFDKDDNALTKLAQSQSRLAMVRLAFDEARAAQPDATLLMNDFIHSAAYERSIEDALDAGVRIDAIGIQTHMHQGYRGEDHILGVIDRFSRFGLPIHMTETTLLSGELMPPEIDDLNDFQVTDWPSTPEGEARQADEMIRHYRSLVAHPSVQAINYWGLTDDGAWLGAPVGVVRRDGSPKPSYDALHRVIKGEWWVPSTEMRTDAGGRIRFSGFLGDYQVDAGGRSGSIELSSAGTSESTAQLD